MSGLQHRTLSFESLRLDGEDFLKFTLHPPTTEPFSPYPTPVVLKIDDKWIPVTGHDRLLGGREAGIGSLTVVEVNSVEPAEGLTLAARDLAWFRPLTDGEKVTAVGKYIDLTSDWAPDAALALVLGLEPTRGVFDAYARVWQLGENAMEALHHERLSPACAFAVIEAPKLERKALLSLFTTEVQPNLNTARRIAENAVAAALMRDCPVKSLLERPEILAVLRSDLDGPKKIATLDRTLVRLRYPELTAATEGAHQAVADLDLPKNILLSFPPTIEPGQVTLSVTAHSEEELQEAIETIQNRLNEKTFHPLFRILGK